VKANFRFPFGRRAVGNKWNFAGILAGACLGMFIIYTPPLHVVFGGTDKLSPLYWLIPIGFGCVMLAWSCVRVVLMKKAIADKRVKDIKGLMMCEWIYSILRDCFFTSIYSPNDAHDEYALKTLTKCWKSLVRAGCYVIMIETRFRDLTSMMITQICTSSYPDTFYTCNHNRRNKPVISS
jgi:hypothetical protein